ncbi:MAG: hypothetical protein N4A45_12530 [Flavobacteriales bacterium]|jgi:hypothetical protein|nr:hypothetical protein [Flavobacteriales bacterium]
MTEAKLFLLGQEIELLWTDMDYLRDTRRRGNPSSETYGGCISMAFETTERTDQILDWMTKYSKDKTWEEIDKMEAGKICFYAEGFDYPPTKTWKFRDAHLIFFEEIFVAEGPIGMQTIIKISPAVQNYGCEYVKPWNVSWKPEREKLPFKKRVMEIPTILSLDWIDVDQNVISEAKYCNNVGLKLCFSNSQEKEVIIKITKKDGTEFEKNKKELFYKEAVKENSLIITGIEIKSKWEEFKTAIFDELQVTAEYFSSKITGRTLQILPSSKVLVEFRPGTKYQGDFGFDWIRNGDTKKAGDIDYKNIIGEYTNRVFKKDPKEYDKLMKTFGTENNPLDKTKNYISPFLSIYPNKKATLSLHLEIKDADAQKIEYTYDKTFFKLNKTEISHKTVGKTVLPDELTIECIKEFSKKQEISISADGKFAGKIELIPNAKPYRYKAEIVFVHVKTDIGNGIKKGSSIKESNLLTKYLNQGIIKPMIHSEDLDLTKDKILNSTYRLDRGKGKSKQFVINDIPSIHNHLLTEFEKVFKQYKGAFKVFFFDENGGEMIKDKTGKLKYQGYNGAAQSTNSLSVVLYNTHNTSTTTHEILHAMGLYHSFSNNGQFTLEKAKTENIMDYSHHKGINRISTWKWQWEKIWKNSHITKE